MIRENTEFPLDAILKKESDRSPVLRGFGRFFGVLCESGVVRVPVSRFPYPPTQAFLGELTHLSE